jgi:hypothetical protein
VKPIIGQKRNQFECRFVTAKLVVLPNQVVWQAWSLFVAIALPCIGTNNTFTPMLCYLDPAGNNGNQDVITNMSIKIQHLLNIMW